MPQVSVVIPCYNQGVFLEDAVESVLEQTFSNFEILVVDDGSTDPATCQLLSKYNRPRTRVIHTANGGVSAARNRGIREARGKYILPLDADDRITRGYLELATNVLNGRSDVGIVYGRAEFFGTRSGPMPLPGYSPASQLWENAIFSAALFRKRDWEKGGGYQTVMRNGWEDWDFWLALTELGVGVVQLPEVVLQYRIRPTSRDRSIRFCQKCSLLASMVARHPRLYLRKGIPGLVEILVRRLRATRNDEIERKPTRKG